MMKTNLFSRCAVLGIGAALLFTAATTRADEPKRKRHPAAEQQADDETATPTKKHGRSGKVPSQDGRNATSADGGQVGGANGRETRIPTGSHIPQTYHRRGYTTDRQDNTFIYDKNDQRLRSTNNVGDSLRSVPGVSIGGMR